MIQTELKKRNVAVLAYLAGMAMVIVRGKVFGITDENLFSYILIFGTAGSLIAACWFYLAAKSRSPLWLFLLPLNGVALVIYWMLADHSNLPKEVLCSKCGAANFPTASTCRICNTELRATAPAGA